LNIFAKFKEPRPLPLLMPVMFGCANAWLLSDNDDIVKITRDNIPVQHADIVFIVHIIIR
jgi:hypothetical protein